MKLRIRSEALALSHAGDNPSHKSTMTQPWRKNMRQKKFNLGWFIQVHSIIKYDWLYMFKLVSWHTLRIRLTIIQCFLICPIGSFFNILKVRVLLTQPSVKYRYLHPRACIRTHINRNAGFNLIFNSRTLITVAHIHIPHTYRCVPSARAHLLVVSGRHVSEWPVGAGDWSVFLWHARIQNPETDWSS